MQFGVVAYGSVVRNGILDQKCEDLQKIKLNFL